MKTSEYIKALDKIRNEVIFKLIANSIISTLIVTLFANKFIEYFSGLTSIFCFGGIILDFILMIYFIATAVDNYTDAYRKLIK